MRSFQRLLVLPLSLLMAMSSSAFAQQSHVVNPAEVAAAVAQHLTTDASDRGAIRDALARPEVREMAARMGLDLSRANAAVDTMDGPDLERVASTARQVNDSLVGGSNVVISTTTIVIVLLLVIVVLLVAR